MARRAADRTPEAVLRVAPMPDFPQERARRSYQALIDAATVLFGERPYDEVGTPEIAERAGVSVGTFYRYFDDKRDVYLEIARRTMTQAHRDTIERLTPELFVGFARHETIAGAIGILFDHVLAHPALTRSLMEVSLRDPAVAEVKRAYDQLAVDKLATLITAITPRSKVPDPEAFAYVLYSSAMQTAYGVAVQLLPAAVDRDRAKAALVATIERTLFPG